MQRSRRTSKVAIDPGKDAKQLATNTISTMVNSEFGNIFGPVISSDILSILGLGGEDKVAEYLAKIQKQLNQIQSEIEQLQQSVNQILAGIAKIEEQVTGVEIQAKLDSFAEQSNMVKEQFSLYADAIGGLASQDPDQIAKAGADLFDLLSLDNLARIATAMTTMQGLFLPTLSEGEGLIDLQHQIVRNAIEDYAVNTDNYLRQPPPACKMVNGWDFGQSIPTDDTRQLYSCCYILDQGHVQANQAMGTSVAGVFKAFLTVQSQGLILLSMGWLGGIHEAQIPDQVTAIQSVLDAIAAFEPAVVKTVDDQVSQSLKAHGVTLSGYIAGDQQCWIDFRNPGPPKNGYPFSTDWIMWQDGVTLAHQPWTLQPTDVVLLAGGDYLPDYGGQVSCIEIAPVDSRFYRNNLGADSTYISEWQFQPGRYAGIPTELQFIRDLKAQS